MIAWITTWGWPLAAGLLLFSFILSGLESACLTIERARLRFEARRGSLKAMTLAGLIDRREQLLAAILILNNAFSVVLFALISIILANHFGPWGYAIALALLLPGHIILGELLPKSLFSHFPFRMLIRFLPLLRVLDLVARPLGAIFPSLRTPSDESTAALDRGREAFRMQTDAIQRTGALEPDETALIQHVLDFETVTAHDLMAPLNKVTAIPLDMPLETVLQLTQQTDYDQFPVMSPNGDFVGQVRVFEVLKSGNQTGGQVSDFVRGLVRVGPAEPAISVLQRLQKSRVELAVVVSQKGRPLGIISSYDIVQALMLSGRENHQAAGSSP
ncbi:MAG: CBS domain containing-hemolysin-like protein [Verrucomicrobiales bacterium]|jgi:CBS domain containing-hemolysin-like protein